MNEFKTREECLRYYVDKYNKERDWEPEVDFDKLLPMLDNPPTVRFVEVSEVIEIRLEDDWLSPDEDPQVVEEVRGVMEYGLVSLCLRHSDAVHWAMWPTEEETLMYLDEVWKKRDFSIVSNWSFMFDLLMWLVFGNPKLWPRAEEKLRQLIYGPKEKPSSSAPAKKKASASKLKRDLIETTIDSLVEKISSFFSTPAAAETFLRRNEDERKRNGHSDRVLTQVIEHYISTHQIVEAPSSLHDLLYRAGYWKTGYSNWNKNFNPTRFRKLWEKGAN